MTVSVGSAGRLLIPHRRWLITEQPWWPSCPWWPWWPWRPWRLWWSWRSWWLGVCWLCQTFNSPPRVTDNRAGPKSGGCFYEKDKRVPNFFFFYISRWTAIICVAEVMTKMVEITMAMMIAIMAMMIVIMAMMVATEAAGQVLWWDSGGWRVYASRPLLIMFLHASNSISLRTKQSWWGNGGDYSDYNEILVMHVYMLWRLQW